jgi:hypothetical protein
VPTFTVVGPYQRDLLQYLNVYETNRRATLPGPLDGHELNDSELITLGWYGSGSKHISQPDEYRQRHEEVLRMPQITGMSTDEDEREAALTGAYREKLRRLGLSRQNRRGNDEITTLGRLLLRQIDFYAILGMEESP